MANEIAARAFLRMVVAGEDPIEIDTLIRYFDMTGTEYVDGIFSIGTSAEDINLGDVGTPGWVFLKNLDATNHIEGGYDTTRLDLNEAVTKAEPGEFTLTRWGAATVTLRADTAACRVRVLIVED